MSPRGVDTVGPYRLLGLLASGGAGQIHIAVRASQGGAMRRYALKTVLPSKAQSDDVELALKHEAQLGTQLLHPNIVAAHDYGRDGDTFYLVMDYVDGSDLAQILERARQARLIIPDILSAWLMSEVCEGLGFAHSLCDHRGEHLKLVHRDISPQNILVGKTGDVRIADFGVARFEQEDRPDTEAGVIKGKLRYMPPEYLLTNSQDHRGDIFAAGLVLFELLTKQPAYPRDESLEITLDRISNGTVQRVQDFRPDIREEMVRILDKALNPDPDRRYNNADDMAGDLKRYIWHTSSGLTRARVGEMLGSLGLFGAQWERPHTYEESMTVATDMAPNPIWEDRKLDDTSPIPASALNFPDPATIPVDLDEITPTELPDDTQRVPVPDNLFDD